MRENSLAKRYAKALVDTIVNEKEYSLLKADLITFNNLLEINPEFKAGMETSLFSKQQKAELFESISSKTKFDKKSIGFLNEIIDANRVAVIDSIIESMELLWFEKTGVEKFKVYSAIKLEKELEKQLIDNLEKKLNKKIVLEKEIDTSLIAGIKLQKGSIYYDFSIEGNLNKLYETLIEGSGQDSETQEN